MSHKSLTFVQVRVNLQISAFLLMSYQESSYDVQVYTFWSMHWVFLSLLTYFSLQDWYFQFYNVCNWLIVVSPLAKGELPDQNFTSFITWPPKAYSMSKKNPTSSREGEQVCETWKICINDICKEIEDDELIFVRKREPMPGMYTLF